ncbi:class I SAM-dependent methyltransferase [Patescibacteria group bacterium]|nr:class I SAM-dependent methyltransferase [Patescibacteria group bacterium]
MIHKIIVKIILRLHTFLYGWAGFFSVKAEGGIHPKHRLTNYHKFFVDNIKSNDSVLDIGCGKGELTFDLAQKAKNVVGIDFNEKSIDLAKNKFSAFNIKYILGNVTEDLPCEKFDVLILSNVLEHIENRVEFLNKIKRLGDKILIRVPMINRDWITLYKKELGLEWRLDGGHFTEYTLESFKKEIEEAGLIIQDYSIQFSEIWAVINS